MRELADDIESGRFADEWDAERDAGYPRLTELKEQHAGPAVREYDAELRRRLGPGAASATRSFLTAAGYAVDAARNVCRRGTGRRGASWRQR